AYGSATGLSAPRGAGTTASVRRPVRGLPPAGAEPSRTRRSVTQTTRRPTSSHVPSTSTPPGPNPAHRRSHATPPSASSDLLRALAQHVERPDQHRRALHRQFEAAEPEGEPLTLVRTRGGHPHRVDLDPHDLHARVHRAQPGEQLGGGDRRGAVPEVDDQWPL